MLMAVPLMAGLLLGTWLLLWVLFKPRAQGLQLEPMSRKIEPRGWFVVIVLTFTVILWLTEPLHGLPTAVVALAPAIAFTATGLLGREDVNNLEWNILILIMGGIALGAGMQRTGARPNFGEGDTHEHGLHLGSDGSGNTAVQHLHVEHGGQSAVTHGVSFATTQGAAVLPVGISIALAASIAMALPVSTPPNAIAYASGEFNTRDIARAGSIVGVLATLLIIAFGEPIINFWLSR
jgi:sodium-dependent dicarboxylate transporter 2/3/5